VAVGEWLIQIARCYGANPTEVIAANRQISDPNFIRPEVDVVTVPRIGSVGKIYKLPGQACVTFITVQSGDTWASLAQRFNADLVVLQKANPGGLVVGKQAKIPTNSAGGSAVVVTPGPGVTFTPTGTGTAPMRITFDPGSTTASRIGVINPNERLQYIVTAAAGQVLTINLTAPPNEVSIGVNNPNGLALKTPDSMYTWSATIATAGDHTINLASLTGNTSKSYTLTVSLTNAATAGPTATSTATQTPLTPAQ
jgi:LysM repeat protein